MSTEAPEPNRTLMGELFGHNPRRRALIALAWIVAFAGQAFAATLLAGDPSLTESSGERASRLGDVARARAPVCRAESPQVDPTAVGALLQLAEETWPEQSGGRADSSERPLWYATGRFRDGTLCPFTWPLVR